MAEVTLSVVIPHYNRSVLLQEALNSVLCQTWKDFEIIVVDDGSCNLEADEARRITCEAGGLFVEISHCGFPGKVRNHGVGVAQGALVAFLDSDDLWLPRKLEQQIALFRRHPEFRWVHTREIWKRGERIVSQRKQKHQREGDLFADALVKCIVGPSTVVINKESYWEVGGFAEEIEIAEDYEFWLRFSFLYPCGYIDEPQIIKRAGEWEQLSEKYGQIEIFRLKALKQFLVWLENQTERDTTPHAEDHPCIPIKKQLAQEEYRRKCEIYATGCAKRDKKEEANHWFAEAASL